MVPAFLLGAGHGGCRRVRGDKRKGDEKRKKVVRGAAEGGLVGLLRGPLPPLARERQRWPESTLGGGLGGSG